MSDPSIMQIIHRRVAVAPVDPLAIRLQEQRSEILEFLLGGVRQFQAQHARPNVDAQNIAVTE